MGMGDRQFLRWIGLALLVIGGLGLLTSLYSLGFWFAERGEPIWFGKLHSYLFEWSDYGPFYYVVVGFFSGLGMFLGRSLRQDSATPETLLKMFGQVGVWVWGMLAVLKLLEISITTIQYPSNFRLTAFIFWDPYQTYLWPPWEGSYSQYTYFLRGLLFDDSPNPAWLIIDLLLSPMFWIVAPLSLSLWAKRGGDSTVVNRAFAGLAILLAGLTSYSVYLLVLANWYRLNFDPEGRVVEFTKMPGFGAVPFYLVFVVVMICIGVLLFRRSPHEVVR